MGLKDKASRINFGDLVKAPEQPLTSVESKAPKTAPGALMAFTHGQRSELVQENERLRANAEEATALRSKVETLEAELQSWEGANATRKLDPQRIRWSSWANRDVRSLQGEDFDLFKQEISDAGGNVQPIKVRPVALAEDEAEFEIVFGHRRHQACLLLGIPVLATIESISDQTLFAEMDRENRSRKDLSAWEQGVMYLRALDQGLYPSNRKMAEHLGVDLSQLGKALTLARLPAATIEAFASPLDLQFRHAKLVSDAAASDPVLFEQRIEDAKKLGPGRSVKKVLEVLLGIAKGGGTVPPPVTLKRGKVVAGSISYKPDGGVHLDLVPGMVTDDNAKRNFEELIQRYLNDLS